MKINQNNISGIFMIKDDFDGISSFTTCKLTLNETYLSISPAGGRTVRRLKYDQITDITYKSLSVPGKFKLRTLLFMLFILCILSMFGIGGILIGLIIDIVLLANGVSTHWSKNKKCLVISFISSLNNSKDSITFIDNKINKNDNFILTLQKICTKPITNENNFL